MLLQTAETSQQLDCLSADELSHGNGAHHLQATLISTACREDECERVKQYGARILTLDQLEGVKVCTPMHSFTKFIAAINKISEQSFHCCILFGS